MAAGLIDFGLVLSGTFIFLPQGFLYFPIFFVMYHTTCLWLVQQTPGKALLNLTVLRSSREATFPWALARSSVGLFVVNVMGLGFLFALLNERRRAIHDFVFDSVVVVEESGLTWSARLKDWAKRRDDLYKKKTELLLMASAVWNFLKWLADQIKWGVQQLERLTSLAPKSTPMAAAAMPVPATLAQAAIIAILGTTTTAIILMFVPGSREVARFIATPINRPSRETGDSVLTTAGGRAGEARHYAIPGSPVLVKAIVNAPPGEVFRYEVDFGDGSAPAGGEIKGRGFVSQSHQYAKADSQAAYVTRIRVTDSAGKEVRSTDYPIDFVDATSTDRVAKALDDALWALNITQRTESPADSPPLGYWDQPSRIGATALAALAFEVNGFDSGAGEDNPYRETVDRALAYLLAQAVTRPLETDRAGNPDSNGNGIGTTVSASQEMYELPMAVMALVGSSDPSHIATTGPEGVRGRRYDEIVADMVDYLAFAQSESDGNTRGGWRYVVNSGDADMSVTQWPVLALMAAEEQWGISVPSWVRTELRDNFLKVDQHPDSGHFYYSPTDQRTSVGMTAAGLIALRFAGFSSQDERVQKAVRYIAAHWSEGNVTDYYYMYSVMKAARLMTLEKFGEHDWFTEYVNDLIPNQRPDGTWDNRGYGTGTLATAWPALILSRNIFATDRLTKLRRWLADAF